ncbi:MAG: class I SAM-dependent methyltransferase [Caldilineaceae bacterium]|nr:class I SAM-dependent methyltransferase [Caldilineaceae bacterium]
MSRELASKRGIPSLVWGIGQQRRLELIVDALKLDADRPRRRLLVNGCGVGAYAKHMSPYFRCVNALDIEPSYLKQARASQADLACVLSQCETLPFPSQHFDVVFSHEVLEHVDDDVRAMSEMARVVRPDGYIVLFVPNRWFPFETHGCWWRGRYYFGNIPFVSYLPRQYRDFLAPHVRTYNRRDLRRLWSNLPLRIATWQIVPPALDALGYALPWLPASLPQAMMRLSRSPVDLLGLSHFVVLQPATGPSSAVDSVVLSSDTVIDCKEAGGG